MATPALNRVAPEVYVRGFDDAYSRIAQVTDSLLERVGAGETVDLLEAFVPVFEALNWAAALSHLESAGTIKIDMDVEELRALRFARDRAHHHWVTALEIADIHVPRLLTNRGGVIAPMVVRAWVWVPLSKLPAALIGRVSRPISRSSLATLPALCSTTCPTDSMHTGSLRGGALVVGVELLQGVTRRVSGTHPLHWSGAAYPKRRRVRS